MQNVSQGFFLLSSHYTLYYIKGRYYGIVQFKLKNVGLQLLKPT